MRLDGIVHAAFDAASRSTRSVRARLQHAGVRMRTRSTGAQHLLAEPWLGKHLLGALLVNGEGYVDNRRLGRALVAACRERGVIV